MPTTWNNINKATGTSWTNTPNPFIPLGSPIGLLMALTYADNIGFNLWIDITKAGDPSWIKITKAT